MRTIGLIGGMSWESTVEYYRLINEEVHNQLGGLHSAKCLLYSVDFGEIEPFMRPGGWEKIEEELTRAAKTLENSGAEVLLICTNTMHKLYDGIQKEIHVPMIHIADAAADAVLAKNMDKVGLLGTRPTMEQDFYRSRMEQRGITVLIPSNKDMDFIHKVIFEELCIGILKEDSRKEFIRIIEELITLGAEGIVLGCTEIPLLIKPEDTRVPLFDTTYLHSMKAVEKALEC